MYAQIYLVHTNVPRFTYTLTYKTHAFIVIYKRRCNVGVNAANSTNSLYASTEIAQGVSLSECIPFSST